MAKTLGKDNDAGDDTTLKRKLSKAGSDDDDDATEEVAPVLTSTPAKKQKQATLGAWGFKNIT